MRLINRTILCSTVAVVAMGCLAVSTAYAQPNAVDNELSRLNGHWRVIEMVEDGNAIPENQMREWLPGGGVFEVVDYTIIFKSPMDGTKSTKSYRLDPTSYPKRIAILERDKTTGTGIYEFDQGRLVICVTNAAADFPTDFSAPTGSKRTLMIMTKVETGATEIPGLNTPLPPRKPVSAPSPPPAQTVNRFPPPAPATSQLAPPPVEVVEVVKVHNPPIVTDTAAGIVLTDSQVRNMTLGTWRLNDTEGSIDIVFQPSGVFQTYRYYQRLANFQVVFVPTPISSGNWSIVDGRLVANVTASTRADRINQSFVPAVRSISATDMILVDHLGRVSRAVKLR